MWHNADANRRTHRVEGSNVDVDVSMLDQKTFSSACWIFGQARVAKNLAKQAICNICNLWIFHQWHKILFQMQNCEFWGKKLVIYACSFCCDKTFFVQDKFHFVSDNSICLGLYKCWMPNGRFFAGTKWKQKTWLLLRPKQSFGVCLASIGSIHKLTISQKWIESPRQKIFSGKAMKNSKGPVWRIFHPYEVM